MSSRSLKPLAIVFAIGGLWDTIGALIHFFLVGPGRAFAEPPTDRFYAVFIGSLLLCFAYLQLLSAFNIRWYALNVGCIVIGRAFYVVQLYAYMAFVEGFPRTLWMTGVIDGVLTLLYLIFAVRGGLGARDLFLPRREPAV